MGLKRDNISSRYFKHTCVAFGFWLLSKVHDLKYVYTLFIPCMGDSRVLYMPRESSGRLFLQP